MLKASSKSPGAVMEVGVHRAAQCLHAAKLGLEAHCVEPSPRSFQRVNNAVKQAPADVQRRVHLYNVAAGQWSKGTVPFTATGGTGDHVGQHNMWKMEVEAPQETSSTQIIEIPSKKLDDIIQHDMNSTNNEVFLLKVDTQGFEPAVFAGLQMSLKQHKIKFVLTEFWPRGMDLLVGKKDACIGASMLQSLANLGYTCMPCRYRRTPERPKDGG